MDEKAVSRLTAVAGFATVIAALIAFAIFGTLSPPNETDSSQNIAKFFADNRTVLAVLVYLVAVSLGLNIIFYVGLRDVLRRRAPAYDTLASVGVMGGAVFIAIAYVGFAVLLQLVYREGAGDADTQKTLFDLNTLTTTMASVPTAVSVGAISALVVRSAVLPAWVGWYGFVVGAAHLIAMGSLARDGFFLPSVIGGYIAPLMFYAWVLAFSVLLWRDGARST